MTRTATITIDGENTTHTIDAALLVFVLGDAALLLEGLDAEGLEAAGYTPDDVDEVIDAARLAAIVIAGDRPTDAPDLKVGDLVERIGRDLDPRPVAEVHGPAIRLDIHGTRTGWVPGHLYRPVGA